MAEPLLRLKSLLLKLQGKTLLDGVDLAIAAGETLGLVGESGSGKTLTALSAIRLEPAQSELQGELCWQGKNLLRSGEDELAKIRGSGIGMVFQDALGSLHPTMSIAAQLKQLLRQHQGLSGKAAALAAGHWLSRVGLETTLLARYPHQLSGGQAQRVNLALALACGPKLLIADEPTSALDVSTQQQVIALLRELRREFSLAVLFITHDLALAAEFCDRIAVMRGGKVLETQSAQALWRAPKSEYARALLACRPGLGPRMRRLPTVGSEGQLLAPPPCRELAPDAVGAETLLAVSNLAYAAPAQGLAALWRAATPILQPVSFSVARGHTLGIIGESGSGKTTLARCLVQLLRGQGSVRFAGQELTSLRPAQLRSYRKRMQMVFQNPFTALNPVLPIVEQLLEPLEVHAIGRNRMERMLRVRQLLDEVSLPESALTRLPREFSGGQLQRICIARALACDPELLICDESVSALDVSVQAQILNLLAELKERRQLTLIFISHDLAVIRFLADQVLVLEQGYAVELARAESLFRAPSHAYTRRLLAAVPAGLPAR